MSEGAPAPQALPDSRRFLERFTPPALLPYVQLARWDRPIGWQLLLAPCLWSEALASDAALRAPSLARIVLYVIGAIAMRGAGSTWNDVADRDLDAGVERTRGRPLPSGRISVRAALAWLVLQALVGLAVLLTFDRFAILVGFASLAIVIVYPFAKRFTSWPQLVLGFAFAWGALLAWAAALGSLHWPALWLYAAAILWTIGYDTIYALQDLRDDAVVGIRSTARLFGDDVRLAVGIIYLLTVTCAEVALLLVGAGPLAQLGLFAFAGHLAWQVKSLDEPTPALALRLFRANRDAGLLFFLGLAADAMAVARGLY